MSQAELRKQLTDQIVEALEGDLLPWRRPWSVSPNAGRAANVVSKNHYSGINPLLLEVHRLKQGFTSKWYGTYNQWTSIGGQVKRRPNHIKRGEWGARIVFFRPVTKTKVDPTTGDEDEDQFFVMRSYTVFSADQVEGDGIEKFQVTEGDATSATPDFAPAEELIEVTEADIRFGGESAFYNRKGDYIQLPHKHRFDPPGSYYETLLHELAHWSEPRLGWDHEQQGYAMGELVAEMASSFLATELGVAQGEGLGNHAAYLKSWLEAMKGDPSFIFKASTQASKVADFLLAFRPAPVAPPRRYDVQTRATTIPIPRKEPQ